MLRVGAGDLEKETRRQVWGRNAPEFGVLLTNLGNQARKTVEGGPFFGTRGGRLGEHLTMPGLKGKVHRPFFEFVMWGVEVRRGWGGGQ